MDKKKFEEDIKLKVLSLSFFRPKVRKPIYHKYIYGLTNQISRFNDLFRLKDNRWIIRIYVDKSPFTMRYSQREEISGVDIHKEKQIFGIFISELLESHRSKTQYFSTIAIQKFASSEFLLC